MKFETARRIIQLCQDLQSELQGEMLDMQRRKLERELAEASARLNEARACVEHRAAMEKVSTDAAMELLAEEKRMFADRESRTVEDVKAEVKRNARKKENRVRIVRHPLVPNVPIPMRAKPKPIEGPRA